MCCRFVCDAVLLSLFHVLRLYSRTYFLLPASSLFIVCIYPPPPPPRVLWLFSRCSDPSCHVC